MRAAQLQRKSRKQLLVLAKAAGIPVKRSATKAGIIKAILAGIAQPSPETSEPTDLPRGYGRTRLVLMEVEPRLIHVYWEIASADFQAAIAGLGSGCESAPWVLRLYDVTGIHFDGKNAHGYFDVPVDLAPGNWYVHLWEGEKTYFAEIGPRAPDGRLIAVCRSNFACVPRADPPSHYEPQWLKVEGETGDAQLVEEPSPVSVPVLDEAESKSPMPDEVVAAVPAPEAEQPYVPDYRPGEPEVARHWAQLSTKPEPDPVLFPPGEAPAPEEPEGASPVAEPEVCRCRRIFSSESVSSFVLGGAVFPSERTVVADRQSSVEQATFVGATSSENLRGDSKWVRAGESGGFILRSSAADEVPPKRPPEGSSAREKRKLQKGK